ncbi:unnamed protein product [Darwinula stevensoni]|uniref:adenosine deaminase n=1 Tax=Darwinula stevensoni TaxID=69355 RepID=A0A7R9AE32_9CRUS|nr:unnamed protein product [Darwinula stevensoni]CAG0901963.1 unnamed protein product [Darwinula stevensoni]
MMASIPRNRMTSRSSVPKGRIELHCHLEGAIRHTTIWELLKTKRLALPGNGSLEALIDALTIHQPKDLNHLLSKFSIFMPAVTDDVDAIERMAFEFVEDEARQGVCYCEVRYCPFLLLQKHSNDHLLKLDPGFVPEHNEIRLEGQDKYPTVRDVVRAVNRGFQRGEEETGVKARSILACIRGMPEWSRDILELCEEFSHSVVGIDIAGDEVGKTSKGKTEEEAMLDEEDVWAFQQAKQKGIHRTVHAGEVGPPQMVQKYEYRNIKKSLSVGEALDVLHAERIGHGYNVLKDSKIYQKCLLSGVHFETCPHSSCLTGAVPLATAKHPIVRFAEDGANFSISRDDPTVTMASLQEEYDLLVDWGLTEAHLARANFNAAMASFLPVKEKKALMEKLKGIYGVPDSESLSRMDWIPTNQPSVKFGTWDDR